MGKKKGLPVKYTVGTKVGNPCDITKNEIGIGSGIVSGIKKSLGIKDNVKIEADVACINAGVGLHKMADKFEDHILNNGLTGKAADAIKKKREEENKILKDIMENN